MAVDYDQPVPFTTADSDQESDDDDLGDEFTDLTHQVSGWYVADHLYCVPYFKKMR